MRIAVTGGAGQLGTLVLRRLVQDRKIKQVVSIDLRAPTVPSAKISSVLLDVRSPDLARHFEGCDAVVHLAFVVVGHLPRALFWDINVGGSKNVFQSAAQAQVKQVVYSSSVAAYGVLPGHPQPLLESSPRRLAAAFPYSATKFEVEAFLDDFEPANPSMAIARLRPLILIGTQMDHPLGGALKKGLLPDIGSSPLPLVWDEDVADAIILCLKKGARGAFNLGVDELLPPKELAQAAGLRLIKIPKRFTRALALATRLVPGARRIDPAWLDQPDVPMAVSSDRAREELGWRPRCKTAVEVLQRYLEVTPRKLDVRIRVFLRAVAASAAIRPVGADTRSLEARIHLALTGPRGGDYALNFHEGRLSVKRGVPRPPTSVIRLSAESFRALMTGGLDFGSAQLTGKLRVEGEPMAGMILQAMVGAIRGNAEQPGARGLPARAFHRWLERA